MNVVEFLPKESFGADYSVIVVRLKDGISGVALPSPLVREAKGLQQVQSLLAFQAVNDLPPYITLKVTQKIAHSNPFGKPQQQVVVVRHDNVAKDAQARLLPVEAQRLQEKRDEIGASLKNGAAVTHVTRDEMCGIV